MANKTGNKYLNEKLKPVLEKALKRAESDFMKCARRINTKICDDVQKMYKTFIEQFYEYETTSYIRHFEGVPGTRYGENLSYPGKGIRKNNQTSHSPKLYVEFWASEMSNSPKYEYHKPEEVLDYVMNGVRFTTGKGYTLPADTKFSYIGKYFSYFTDTIQDAFDLFDKDWDRISSNAFYSIWGEYVSKW